MNVTEFRELKNQIFEQNLLLTVKLVPCEYRCCERAYQDNDDAGNYSDRRLEQ